MGVRAFRHDALDGRTSRRRIRPARLRQTGKGRQRSRQYGDESGGLRCHAAI